LKPESHTTMKIKASSQFVQDYKNLPPVIQKRTYEKLQLLLSNPQYPSLRIKKMRGVSEIWEGRVSKNYRFTFKIQGDTFILRKIGTHDLLKNP